MTPEQKAEQYAEGFPYLTLIEGNITEDMLYNYLKTAYLTGFNAASEWVKFPENKPEKDGEYLVSVQYYTSTETEIAKWFDDFGGWSFESAKTCGRQFVNYEVIAFMPKPEPYNP